jgi:hypothetical protein
MKRLFFFGLVALGLTLAAQTAQAQYKNAIGLRAGTANGLSFKTFGKKNNAFDFILNFQSKGDYNYFRFTALYEIHNQINNAEGLQWYYGFGGTVGSRKYKPTDGNEMIAAIDGVIGLDYKFNGAPINLALDWKPAIEVAPNTGFDPEGFGLSLRFTF